MMLVSTVADKGETTTFQDKQQADTTLRRCFEKAMSGDFRKVKNGQQQFYIKDRTVFLYFASPLQSMKQLVVPLTHRHEVMETSHDSIFAGHLRMAMILKQIQTQVYQPDNSGDVKRFVQSCLVCQRMAEWGSVCPAPIHSPYHALR